MDCQKIEIVGVAGTGKSTLARTLADRDPGNRIADSLHTKTSAHWAYVAHSAPRVLPLVARSARVRPAFDWEETKFIVYVTEWRRFLRRACRDDSGLVVLDQGPVFALARLLWGRKPVTATREFEHWLDQQVAGWSVDLDGIVSLVAPEEVLLGRINEREQDHEAKGRSIREGHDVLLAHQRAYAALFERFEALGKPPVFTFDTSVMSPVRIAEEIEGILGRGPSRRPVNAGSSR
jgi:broad-specificity NMP kinase